MLKYRQDLERETSKLSFYNLKFKIILIKCFGVCGCSSISNGQCKNCNSSLFRGYHNPNTLKLNSFSSIAPNTDGASCSINTEYTDVSK